MKAQTNNGGTASLLRVLLPRGDYVLDFANVYIDESGTHAGSAVLCLAGFLYERDAAIQMDAEWRAILQRESMRFMHMKDFTQPGRKPYAHIDEPNRDRIARELIGLIRKHRTLAFISAVNEEEYAHAYSRHVTPYLNPGEVHSAYNFCLSDCRRMVATWADRHNFHGEIAYFFEAGHADEADAVEVMQISYKDELLRKWSRLGSYTFRSKEADPLLQSADMLAWLGAKWFRRCVEEKIPIQDADNAGMRKDLVAILFGDDANQRNSVHRYNAAMLRREFITRNARIFRGQLFFSGGQP